MELKLFRNGGFGFGGDILIVPYGIETGLSIRSLNGLTNILIVPYGIETFNKLDKFFIVG